MKFLNKIALVTGGSSGIGAACVNKFVNEGAKTYILDINPSINELDRKSIYLNCDISNYQSVVKNIESIYKKENRIDILISNAGIYHIATIEDTSIDDMDKVLSVNLKGTLYILKTVLPIMRKQTQGKIILVGSDQCFIGKTECSVYGATKGAIGQLAKSTALDYAKYNIQVNCVCPGPVKTPLYEGAIDYIMQTHGINNRDDIYRESSSGQPLNYVAEPTEIANLISYLCSDESTYMTGALIPIDGGYTAK